MWRYIDPIREFREFLPMGELSIVQGIGYGQDDNDIDDDVTEFVSFHSLAQCCGLFGSDGEYEWLVDMSRSADCEHYSYESTKDPCTWWWRLEDMPKLMGRLLAEEGTPKTKIRKLKKCLGRPRLSERV